FAGAADAGFDFAKFSAAVVDNEDTLDFLAARARCRRVRICGPFELALGPHGEGLNGNREDVAARGGDDFSRGGETGSNIRGRVVEGNNDFKVLGLLARGSALRGGQARRAEDG